MECYIGVDIGTTHTKAVVITAAGQVLDEAKAGYPTHQSLQGYSEQDPTQLFDAVVEVLRKVITGIDRQHTTGVVSFSAAMHSIMAVDALGQPLTALYTWADTRSHRQAAALKGSEKGSSIYLQTGTPIHPMSPLCKIAWIREELPEVFEKAAKFISGKEYICHQLFGDYLIDYSMASATGMFDIHGIEWSKAAMSFAGINTAHLSEPVAPFHIMPPLKEEYRQAMGLKEDVPFVIGATDGILAILGTGAILPEEAALTIGTSGAVRKISEWPLQDLKGRLFNYLISENMYMCGGAINNGGIVLKWFAENVLDKHFSSDDAFNWFMECAGRSPAGSEGLIFLPYVYGERSPVWEPNARGVFIGISHVHTKEHFMRAILEGISFSLNQILKAMEETGTRIDTIYASGGFIQSGGWVQMLSDILNKKLVVSYAADASAMGAAFVGMYALGIINDWKTIRNMTESSTAFYPNPGAHQEYLRNMQVFENLYTKLREDLLTLSGR